MEKKGPKKLTEAMYYVLLNLTVPRHGYQLMREIEDMTQGRVQVGAGTLYGLIGRFEKEGLIDPVSDDGRRKTYLISREGRRRLLAERKRLALMVEDGRRALEETP